MKTEHEAMTLAHLELLSDFLEHLEATADVLGRAELLTTDQATSAFRDFAEALRATRRYTAALQTLTVTPDP